MRVQFIEPSLPDTGTLAVGVLADGALTASAAELDERTGGLVGRILAANSRFKGKPEEVVSVTCPAGTNLTRLVLFGLGAPEKLDDLVLQRAGGGVLAHLNQAGDAEAAVRIDAPEGARLSLASAAAAFAYGALLRSYRFDRYRTKEKPESRPTLTALTVMAADPAAATALYDRHEKVAQGVFLTRDLVTEPANKLFPESFAEQCRALESAGLLVEVLGEAEMRDLGMNALLAVGEGSARESRLVVMQWNGAPDAEDPAPVAFVGKGVTFDTGGISLKQPAGMEDMKWDMGGAGVVTGLMKALALRRARVNAVGVIGLVENMPSGTAQRPGDVVTSMSKQTIEVLNTDAEGRLVLADALWYTQDRFKPRMMIDLATLTGAVMVAIGLDYGGVFSNDDALAVRLVTAGEAVGEKLWRLPLGDVFDKQIDSDIADVKNIADNRWAGASIGGQFLQRFVRDVPWAHLDIAGVTWSKKDKATVPKGGTAFGVRLLDRLVADHYELP